jgi:ribosomal protein L11 methylase PrmA
LQLNPQGISTASAATLLPFKTRFNLSLLLHIYLPNKIKGERKPNMDTAFSKQKLLNIIANLKSLTGSLKPAKTPSAWNNYYEATILSNAYLQAKTLLVKHWLSQLEGNIAIDIGTNTGIFAIEAAAKFKNVIAIDADEHCINDLYIKCKTQQIKNILPLCVDITNPTPAIGWLNEERKSFIGRLDANLVLALALIHHLVIAKNISMEQVVNMFKQITDLLLIEFVPKEDPKVAAMLSNRADIFDEYNQHNFETCFSKAFNILKKETLEPSTRILYLMQKK